MPRAPVIPITRDKAVDTNTYILDTLQAGRDSLVVLSASAFPDPRLFPLQQLNRSLAQVSKTATAVNVIENLPSGNTELRQAIACRYTLQGITIPSDEIVIIAGALETLNLSLQMVTEPGGWVTIENLCFYGALQMLERLWLKTLSVTTDVKEGTDLQALKLALQDYPVKTCWLTTNSQNLLGFTLMSQKKAQLMASLNQYNVTLAEDDVYSEPYFEQEKPLPAKMWNRHSGVLHCPLFSKCLVPGFRISWVAAEEHARRIQRLQLIDAPSTGSPMQPTLVDYLSTRRYDAHLRRLRYQFVEHKQRAWQALLRYLSTEVKIRHSDSDCFLWLKFSGPLDTDELGLAVLIRHISIAPGRMFPAGESWPRLLRLNTAWQWGGHEEQAVKQLDKLIQKRLQQRLA